MENTLPVGSFKIVEGPSKFDFMLSLFDSKVVKITCDLNLIGKTSVENATAATFSICPKLDVVVQSVCPEDGSRNRWLGEVYFVDKNYEQVRRKFYYDLKTRKGYIREISE